MSREIKMRGWDIEGQRWFFMGTVDDAYFDDYRNKPAIVPAWQLYTDHNDSNGVEIYEGDKVHHEQECGNQTHIITGVVKYGVYSVSDMQDCGEQDIEGFHVDGFSIYNRADGSLSEYTHQEPFPLDRGFKVIGNIYDNPETLEAAQ